jgi:peroxiredoxin
MSPTPSDVGVGAVAPDFSLLAPDGSRINLRGYSDQSSILLVFLRDSH